MRCEMLPIPTVKHGKSKKERSRTKLMRWRKKRSNAGKKRKEGNQRRVKEKILKTFQHRRTKKYSFISVESNQENINKLFRWIELQLNKHGWYELT